MIIIIILINDELLSSSLDRILELLTVGPEKEHPPPHKLHPHGQDGRPGKAK